MQVQEALINSNLFFMLHLYINSKISKYRQKNTLKTEHTIYFYNKKRLITFYKWTLKYVDKTHKKIEKLKHFI